MKYCVYCGQKLDDKSVFCSKCGSRQPNIAQQKTAPTQPAAVNSRNDIKLIKDYLKGAAELEWTKYELQTINYKLTEKKKSTEDAIQASRNYIGSMKRSVTDNQNRINHYQMDTYHRSSASFSLDIINDTADFYGMTAGGLYGALIVLYLFGFSPVVSIVNRFVGFLENSSHPILIGVTLIVLAPALVIWLFFFVSYLFDALITGAKENKREAEFNVNAQKKKEKDIQYYRNQISDCNSRIKSEEKKISNLEKITLPQLQRELRNNQRAIDKNEGLLKDYYKPNVIYPKYQALVPVCTMYEYFDSQRVSSFTGHEGAYNLYENEYD